ncbi:hypothetical protein H4R24_000712 [Coemansia sp. RSA 988]|nr:hypothetical protein H4R24_000712 [Coemansia sp. RSA 988]
MDYRDRDGYLQEDVLRVLGRSMTSNTSADSTIVEPSYGRLRNGNYEDDEAGAEAVDLSDSSSTTSTNSSGLFSRMSFDEHQQEWEDAKRMLYAAFIGTLLPMAFRYIGRRTTFNLWTRFLETYFKT